MPSFSGSPSSSLFAGSSPAFDISFLTASALDYRLSFTRGTVANSFSSTGLLTTQAIDEPRFDHDLTGTPYGILIEEYGANYLLWCRDLTNAAWVKSSMTTAKTSTGIDGTGSSCTRLTASGSNATIKQTLTRVSAARITSAYIKRITGSGTINMTQDNGTTWTVVTATASWTRVSIPQATTANPIIGFRIVTSTDAIDVDYVQHEEVMSVPTSPILTTTVFFERAPDTPFLSFPFGASRGTIIADFISSATTASAAERVLCLDDGTINNSILPNRASTGGATLILVGGVLVVNSTFGSLPASTAAKFGIAWVTDNVGSSINGSATNTVTPTLVPSGMTTLNLGQQNGGSTYLNGWITRLRYYRTRLSDAAVKSLTT